VEWAWLMLTDEGPTVVPLRELNFHVHRGFGSWLVDICQHYSSRKRRTDTKRASGRNGYEPEAGNYSIAGQLALVSASWASAEGCVIRHAPMRCHQGGLFNETIAVAVVHHWIGDRSKRATYKLIRRRDQPRTEPARDPGCWRVPSEKAAGWDRLRGSPSDEPALATVRYRRYLVRTKIGLRYFLGG
jgi:hypothetical protein